MTLIKSAFVSAVILLGATVAANAQWQYPVPPQLAANPYSQAYQVNPYNQIPATPPSWSYDPYTSGLGPCPQRGAGDDRCSERISPTYGQPSYWSR